MKRIVAVYVASNYTHARNAVADLPEFAIEALPGGMVEIRVQADRPQPAITHQISRLPNRYA